MKEKSLAFAIGLHKCGTSWLHAILQDHPQIEMLQRDRHFFSRDWEYKRGIDSFRAQINPESDAKLLLEMSSNYFVHPKAIERIKHFYPSSKLFLLLRHPAKRAYSHYLQSRKTGDLKATSFEEAIQREEQILSWGKYQMHMLHLLKHFSKKQFFVLILDDLKKEPVREINKLTQFLGIDSLQQEIDASVKVNAARMPKYQSLEKLQNYVYYRLQSSSYSRSIWQMAKKSGLGNLIRSMNTQKIDEQLSPETFQKLTDYYREDIDFMSEFLGREVFS